MKDRDRQFADAARVIDESLAIRSVRAACSALETAVEGSRAAGRLRRAAAAFRLKPLEVRVQHVAVPVAIACLTHIALTRLMPRRLSPVVPVAWWIAAAVAATVVAIAADPLTNAWRHRRG